MAVNIIWSLTNGGEAISDIIDHGNQSNGETTDSTELFIRHDGLSEITDVGLYIRQYSDAYSGSFTPVSDFNEIIGWGDEVTADAFGGFMCNLNAIASYPASSWPTYSSKSPTGGFVHRTGVGDSEGNAVAIPTTTGATAAGHIQTGLSPNVRFSVRVQVPALEDTVGIRQWDQVLTFSYTS